MRKVLLLLVMTACTGSRSPECETAVANATTCIEAFCEGRDGKLCDCVRQGKDVDFDCDCTGSIDASFEQALCEDQIPPDTFHCGAATDAFSVLATGIACAGYEGGCEGDDECGPSSVCVYGRCTSSCDADHDCGAGEGRICQHGKCVSGCRDDLDCYQVGESRSHTCSAGKCVER